MLPEEDWDRMFDVNVKGIYHCVNAAMPFFLKKHQGSVITVSSMWGEVGASCEAGYSATKGAVIALSKALAKELGPSGIRVNCITPGVILTDMCAGVEEEILEEMKEETPVGRNGTPEDVAKAMVFLADAPFITGEVLRVNGGFLI
jgi:3-oxoacyl-[acyl-carrier protein] reductase